MVIMSSDNLAGIQAQHKTLEERVHVVCTHLTNGSGVDDLRDDIDDLVAFLHTHCKEEEKLMKRYRYNGVEAHEREHQELLDRFVSVRDKIYTSFNEEHKQELLDFFKRDLLGHVMEDMQTWQEGKIDKKFAYQRLHKAAVGTVNH